VGLAQGLVISLRVLLGVMVVLAGEVSITVQPDLVIRQTPPHHKATTAVEALQAPQTTVLVVAAEQVE
jgi:hypothetical protein